MQQRTNISPDTLQQHFESAANAAMKGQAQYFTPPEWARALAGPLPQYRLNVVDLNCGNGQLVTSVAAPSTHHVMGVDIQPPGELSTLPFSAALADNRVTADLTRFHPFLRALDWQADLFVLNPPWDLHWYRDRLSALAESDCPAVRDAFAAHDGRTGKDTIDSTVATMAIALDRMSPWGEGVLIGNEASLQRLILADNAPHAMLREHVWLHFSIAGNICQKNGDKNPGDFRTGVIYFARGHSGKTRELGEFFGAYDQLLPQLARDLAAKTIREFRNGAEIKPWAHTKDTADLWKAAAEEWNNQQATGKRTWNLWLDADGTIRTDLSIYDQRTGRVSKQEAHRLFQLNGQHPMALIMQVAHRRELTRATFGNIWRVAPAVSEAVTNALAEYDRVRAPMAPLSKIQRLGYLDENEDVLCEKSLAGHGKFRAGERYKIRTETLRTKRSGEKMNVEGQLDDVEWEGSELAIYLTDADGVERLFMDARLRSETVKFAGQDEGKTALDKIDYTLPQLADHFHIPEVPDVSIVRADEFKRNLELLAEIEQLINGGRTGTVFAFKKFQREDYARAACHEGVILGHDTGGGKGLALFIWPVLKTGFKRGHVAPIAGARFNAMTDGGGSLCPSEPVLLVVPGDLHAQVQKEGEEKFRAAVTVVDSQERFLELSTLDATGRRTIPAGYYITSYTQLASNGVATLPKFDAQNIMGMMELLGMEETSIINWYKRRGEIYRRQYQRLSATPEMTGRQLFAAWQAARVRYQSDTWQREVDVDFELVRQFAGNVFDGEFNDLEDAQQAFVMDACVRDVYRECHGSIGESKQYPHGKIKCVWSASLADLCQDTFAACAVDEGVKMKGEDTIVGQGVRQINSRYKLVLTATPIKNRLPDIFRLAWWATGAKAEAHARFPYPDSSEAREEFAGEFLISERNLTKEEKSEEGRRYVKMTPQVCNVHRLWKMLGPIVLRRRKKDFGEDIVQKHRHVVRVPMGREQAATYKFHLDAEYLDRNGRPAIGAQLQALRVAAANPASKLLERPFGDRKTKGEPRSRHTYMPKLAACLKLIDQILRRGEQVVVFSAFHDSLDALAARLDESGVKHCVLDGRMSQKKRGAAAARFKQGPPKSGDAGLPSPYPVMLAGVECMAEGHSFHLCNNVILLCYSWAYDKFEQAINRVHRLNSRWDVNVYPIICDGSIDRKLEAMIQEKGDAAELVLDGQLLGEHQSEVNLAELLMIARDEFSAANTIDEASLEKDWPKLRLQLGRAMQQWHIAGDGDAPAITGPMEITMSVRKPKADGLIRTAAPKISPSSKIIPFESVQAVAEVEQDDDLVFAEMPLWKQMTRPVKHLASV